MSDGSLGAKESSVRPDRFEGGSTRTNLRRWSPAPPDVVHCPGTLAGRFRSASGWRRRAVADLMAAFWNCIGVAEQKTTAVAHLWRDAWRRIGQTARNGDRHAITHRVCYGVTISLWSIPLQGGLVSFRKGRVDRRIFVDGFGHFEEGRRRMASWSPGARFFCFRFLRLFRDTNILFCDRRFLIS